MAVSKSPFPASSMSRRNKTLRASQRYWIGYCRKSTDSEDKQVHSLQDQATMIKEYYERMPTLEKQGKPLRLFEEARSAYHPGRPVFESILHLASRGEVQGVIVVHPNRISRNHADSGAFVQRLVDGAIASLDTTTGKRYTGADSNDIFMLTLEGAMSWKDSRDKGDRIRHAMRLRASEGKHIGIVRLGYRSISQPDGSRSLETVPEEAPLIRRLFELAATGTYSVQALVNEARRLGLRSRRGKLLTNSVVHSILRDPLYNGYIRFDGIVSRGKHEPLVDEDTWNRVQDILAGRRTRTSKAKDLSLRKLFVFGSLLKCPHCGRCLSPYRAKGKYIYYECKNPHTKCGVLVPQATLLAQLPPLLAGIRLSEDELDWLRSRLLKAYESRSRSEVETRRALSSEYDKVTREIGEVFAQRKAAEAMGILDAVDLRLAGLRQKRDALQAEINACHERGNAWIEKVIRTFRLVELLQEAIFARSGRPREMALKALASNYRVEGKTLVLELKAPFRQCAQRAGHPEWWSSLDDVRTEVSETFAQLEMLASLLQQGIFA